MSVHWQETQRRACAPGAHWNVQVVKGKVTTRCLWYACKALGIGLLLMLLGACMATIGYYADQLSTGQEIRGNVTVKVKNKSKGFHLNNLSYAGPIVMGIGGFIVVAACVMTFEARDSAAKVVPARFRLIQGSTLKYAGHHRPRRSTSSQTNKWDHQLGLFRVTRTPSPNACEISRKQLTAEFLHFSQNLSEKNTLTHPMKKSPSAPSLVMKKSPARKRTSMFSGCSLLNPELLQRHALSVDNAGYASLKKGRESLDNIKTNGSQVSMAMDLYIPNKGLVTLKIKDRSDTARRHQLSRQTKIEDMEEEEEEEARRQVVTRRRTGLVAYMMCTSPMRKKESIDQKLTDGFAKTDALSGENSAYDSAKISPNFYQMSVMRSLSHHSSSHECRKCPDSHRCDRKYVMEEIGMRLRKDTAGNLHELHDKLNHSKHDERRNSLDRYRHCCSHRDSGHSLNTSIVIESCSPEYELKYFTPSSNNPQSSRKEDTHVIEIEKDEIHATMFSVDAHSNSNALLKESESDSDNNNIK